MNNGLEDSFESGLGAVEIIISMTLVNIILISFFPILLTSLKVSSENSLKAEALQVMDSQMANARSYLEAAKCDSSLIPTVNTSSNNVKISSIKLICPKKTTSDLELATYTVVISRKIDSKKILENSILLEVIPVG